MKSEKNEKNEFEEILDSIELFFKRIKKINIEILIWYMIVIIFSYIMYKIKWI